MWQKLPCLAFFVSFVSFCSKTRPTPCTRDSPKLTDCPARSSAPPSKCTGSWGQDCWRASTGRNDAMTERFLCVLYAQGVGRFAIESNRKSNIDPDPGWRGLARWRQKYVHPLSATRSSGAPALSPRGDREHTRSPGGAAMSDISGLTFDAMGRFLVRGDRKTDPLSLAR
jgi:hypothetical protein